MEKNLSKKRRLGMKKRQTTEQAGLISLFDTFSVDIDNWQKTLDEKQEAARDLSLAVQNLRSSLKVFSGEYYTRVGIYYARLELIEVELDMYRFRLSAVSGKGSCGPDVLDSIEKETLEKFGAKYEERKKRLEETQNIGTEHRRTLSRLERAEMLAPERRKQLCSLFRKLALQFHPDKAKNEREAAEFTDIMAAINEAYAEADLDLLVIFMEKAEEKERIKSETPAEKLLRLQSECSEIEGIIEKLKKEQAEILSTEMWNLKEKVEEARIFGDDLLAEMTKRAMNELEQKKELLASFVEEYRKIVDDVLTQSKKE
jgi:hypothetical protein